jgi:hypothetical protein
LSENSGFKDIFKPLKPLSNINQKLSNINQNRTTAS